jgi:hypothetical protein
VRIEVKEGGQAASAAAPQFERLQTGIQSALLVVPQAVKQEDGCLQLSLRDLQHRGIHNCGNGLHIAAHKKLPLLDVGVDGRVQINTGNLDAARR